jgi:hypothetical protein
VDVKVIEVRRVDGRFYPPLWPHTPPEVTQRLVDLAHHLRCREHLSYRQVAAVMLSRYGERRSVGQVWKDVQRNECPWCLPELTPPPPDPRMKARAIPWR